MLSTQVEAVVGVHNGAASAVNITALAGSLNNAKAFSQHFQNFSAQVSTTGKAIKCNIQASSMRASK